MTKGKILKSMLDNLEYDQQIKESDVKMEMVSTGQSLNTHTAMFVFAGGDLNTAAYHLIESLKNPFSPNAIASVFVEESVFERFLVIARPQLPKYDIAITQNPVYKKAMETVSRLSAKTIEEFTNDSSGAILVCDFTHEHLGSGFGGIVTLHSFRTAKEAIALFALSFANATIWNENHSCAYELVAALHCQNFFLNCYQVPLDPLVTYATSGGNYVTMDKSYHYETFSHGDVQKSIVFPVGTIFAN